MGEVVPFPASQVPADLEPIERLGVVGGVEVLTALVDEPALDGPAVAVVVMLLDAAGRTLAAYPLTSFPNVPGAREVAHEFAVCTLKGLAVAHIAWQPPEDPPAAG